MYRPTTSGDDPGHTIVGFDRDDLGLRALVAAGYPDARREWFRVRCDSQSFHVHAAVAGLAVAGIQRAVGRAHGLVELDVDLGLPPVPVWLVTHCELRRNPRVRLVLEALRHGLRSFFEGAAPGAA